MYLPQRLGLSRRRCSYRALPRTSFTCRADGADRPRADRPHNPNADSCHADYHDHNPTNDSDSCPSCPNCVSNDSIACAGRVFRCLCMATRYAVELCYANLVLRTL